MITSWRAVLWLFVITAVVFVGSALMVAGPPRSNLGPYVVLAALNTLPLLALRRNPLAVVASLAIAYPLWVVLDQGTAMLQSLPTLVAMYAAGAWQRPLWLRTLALLAPLWMMGADVSGWWDVGLVELGYVAAVLLVVWMLGVVVAERQAYATELEAKTELLEAGAS